ncbi:UAA-domain-containing protein, partial [Acaromyces ingoldii]
RSPDSLTHSSPKASRRSQSAMTGAAYMLALVPEWSLTLSLIFGGCCANAYYLEEATRQQPSCGTLLTFLHFACTTLQTLPGQLEWKDTTAFPRLRTPAVPVSRWAMQVLLYFASSLLNNSAFAFHVPVPVHIIFRSGGLVVNMALGWLIHRRRYSALQIVSVVAVTGGVIAATLATTPSSEAASSSSTTAVSSLTYFSGIGLLVLALVLSSLMGLYQEGTFAQYGSQHWREALFYNHFLSMPLFAIRRGTLAAEWAQAKAGPRVHIGPSYSTTAGKAQGGLLGLDVPALFPSLLLNILTQLLCINGVNRLTAQVSSLTVTLVLVVRKAVSLAISVLVLAPARGEAQQEGVVMLAAGAAAVCLGTVGYAVGAGQQQRRAAADKAQHEQTDKARHEQKDKGSVQDGKLAQAGRASSIEQTAGSTALDSSSSQARLRARKQ